jgi:rfaE bifunctional protein kinase chain/domain
LHFQQLIGIFFHTYCLISITAADVVHFTGQRIQELLTSFVGKRIAVVGDLMVDRYYWGTVSRVSPEAPVPVVDVISESVRLGGAANVASNIQALGGEPILVGLVGDDHPGTLFHRVLKEQNLSSEGIVKDPDRPTTIKTRVIAHGQHVVRIDNESKSDCPEQLEHRLIDAVKYNIQKIDGIVLEDYNKGVFTKNVIAELIAVARKYGKIITVDPKFNNFFEFRHVTVFKPNKKEAEEVMGQKLKTDDAVMRAGKRLQQELAAETVLITRGEEGMSVFEPSGDAFHLASSAENVQDVSGAGDTVISTLTIALASGASVREASTLANCAAGVVVGSVGIVPILPDQLRARALLFSRNSHGGA